MAVVGMNENWNSSCRKNVQKKSRRICTNKKQMHAFAAQPSTGSRYSVLPLTRQLTLANVSHQISFPPSDWIKIEVKTFHNYKNNTAPVSCFLLLLLHEIEIEIEIERDISMSIMWHHPYSMRQELWVWGK